MKNIIKIFFSDMKALISNFYVLAIVLGLCILPALYAWFNIYANRNPYGNARNIKIAVASKDYGYTNTYGQKMVASDVVTKPLKEDASVRWVFTTPKKARKGVYSGKYYASVIFTEDFSACMYNGFMRGLEQPTVKYFQNEKKNAVASKMTDAAISRLQENINELYISSLVSNIFNGETAANNIQHKKDSLAMLQDKIRDISENLDDYSVTVASLTDANKKLKRSINKAIPELDNIPQNVQAARDKVANLTLSDNLLSSSRLLSSHFTNAAQQISKAASTDNFSQKATFLETASSNLTSAEEQAKAIISSCQQLPGVAELDAKCTELASALQGQLPAITSLKERISQNLSSARTLRDRLINMQTQNKNQLAKLSNSLENALQTTSQRMTNLNSAFQDTVFPVLEGAAQAAATVQKDIENAAQNITEDIDLLKELLTGTKSGLSSANKSLDSLTAVLAQANEELAQISAALGNISASEWLARALAFATGDPESYGQFFATPVKIETQQVYPVKDYGSGVAPFYTTLALWAGGVFLVSLLKVNPSREKFPDARPHELFLGRFGIFLLIGQLQVLILAVGNITLLQMQCMYPRRFWFACAVTGLTFLLLIYALTVSFGDIGKAAVVVLMVIQIAGSSGTYPIEILPTFYRKIYIFFPFPYAVNAMRETIGGLKGNDYFVYLSQLLLFAAAALVLGFAIRLPFLKLARFLEKRMEDTEIM